MERPKLSVVIITLNEEMNIRRCLDSVRFSDEIILVDSGSSDNTCLIAKEYTDKVIFHEMRGFGEQKQFAVEQSSGEWILSLDADEWISKELQHSLKSLMRSRDIFYDGYLIYRRNIYLGKPMHYCGWYRPILRLFRREQGSFNNKLVHEEIHVTGRKGLLRGDLMHEPYRDIFHQLEKMKHYAPLDAQELIRRGRTVYGWESPVHLLLRPIWKLIEKFILQQGFREGIHGLVLSCMAAIGVFLIHVTCWQLQKGDMPFGKDTLWRD